ncbi:MAG: hypothetical protein J6U80_05875 [Bacteroidales bacterium]|nr:hypothetical protein [Bacteroidales bacterium]
MQYVEPIRYKNYEIYREKVTDKYGIRNVDTDLLIVKCMFDKITLYPEAKLFLFELNGKEAVYNADNVSKLMSI